MKEKVQKKKVKIYEYKNFCKAIKIAILTKYSYFFNLKLDESTRTNFKN